jgi:8-oxo-dGTP pyrophosphatase MutT (NUDIX family)
MYIIHTPFGQKSITTEADFKNYTIGMEIIEAAGGMVLNTQGDVLMIYRRGFWDLPKGKIDPGESTETCAIREVQEETGINRLEIIEKLQITYHTYTIGNKNIMKPSHWFRMIHTDNEKTIPQTEEDISEIRWMNQKEVTEILDKSYASISELLSKHYLK